MDIIIPIVLILISGHIIWRSTDLFAISADYLGRKMSQGVKGASLNAVASSMPEFLTTMFFLFYIKDTNEFADSFSGGLGVVAGSAIFNILIIPLAVILFGASLKGRGRFSVDKRVLQRDGIFLIFSNIVFILVISQPEIQYWHGLILVGIYMIYLFLLRKGFGIGVSEEVKQDFSVEKKQLKFRHWWMLDLKQILLNGKSLTRASGWILLLLSTLIMTIGTWMLVHGMESLGKEFNLPLVFLSVLIAAAATSIPDTMISVRDARRGNHDDSISNAIGSNIFDLSFALGLPIFLYTLISGDGIIMSFDVQVISVSYWLFMWFITIVVVATFLMKKEFTRGTGVLLALLYGLFIIVVLEDIIGIEIFKKMAGDVINLFI